MSLKTHCVRIRFLKSHTVDFEGKRGGEGVTDDVIHSVE